MRGVYPCSVRAGHGQEEEGAAACDMPVAGAGSVAGRALFRATAER